MYKYKMSFTSFKNKFNQNWKDEEVDKKLFHYLILNKLIDNDQIFTDLEIDYNEKFEYPEFKFTSHDNLNPPFKIGEDFFVNETMHDLLNAPLKDKVKLEDIAPIIPKEYKFYYFDFKEKGILFGPEDFKYNSKLIEINYAENLISVQPENFKENSEKLLMYASFLQSAYDALGAISKISENLETFNETKAISFFTEYDTIQELNNKRIDIWQQFVNGNIEKITEEEKRKEILAINARMQQLKSSEADIIEAYNQAQKEFQENLSKDLWDEVSVLLEQIGKEIEKGIQNVGKEAEKFAQDLGKNLEKGIQDIGKQLERDVQNGGMAIEASVNFIGDQIEAYGKALSNAEKRLREGKIVDAIWHLYTDPIKYGEENFAKAVQNSSLINSIASSAAVIYGGPGGAAAYAAWYTYKQTNDLSLALKTGLITGLTSYYTKQINGTGKLVVPKDELLKKTLATSAIGAAAIAASGGDEKAILEGFLKGAALSIASHYYKSATHAEIDGKAPTEGPVLKLGKIEDKYLILRNKEGVQMFTTAFDKNSGEYLVVPNAKLDLLTLQELGKNVSMVGIGSQSYEGLQLISKYETGLLMQGLAKLPYMNDMAFFHDQWCDALGSLNAAETAITILPAMVFTVGGSPTPLLEQLQELAIANKAKIEGT